MLVYDSIRGQLICIQFELLSIFERVVVVRQCSNFWILWCIYLHDRLVAMDLGGCIVAFNLFRDEVEHCIGVFTDWHKAKVEIFHQIQYSELTTFLGFANWVTQFAEDGVNWNNTLSDDARSRSHYTPVSVFDGGEFPVGFHPLLINQHFRDQYDHFLTGTIAGCWVWTIELH
jgi:hypothetical protein